MKSLGLLFSLALLAFGIWFIITDFTSFAFHWSELLLFIVIALIVYGIVWAVGTSLDKQFSNSVKSFIAGTKTELFDDKGLIRVFGFLLIVLLPLLIYFWLLAAYLAVAIALYSVLGISYLPRVPIILYIALAIIVIGTIVAVILGLFRLFFPAKEKTLGIEVKANKQPKLWAIVHEVARGILAKPINKIIISPYPGIGVYLQGSVFVTVFGGGQRVLKLGLPSIHNMNVEEFKAILTHECGHFSNKDTQWNSFTFSMGNSLLNSLKAMPGPPKDGEEGGGLLRLLISINQGYWILYVFVVLYFRITSGFSRIGEVRADLMAMALYGGSAFSNGLLKVATNDAVFNELVQEGSRYFAKEGKVITNFSKFMEFAYDQLSTSDIERIRSLMLSQDESGSTYDSHPSLKTRLDYANRFYTIGEEQGDLVYSLFDSWDRINETIAKLYYIRLGLYFAPSIIKEIQTEAIKAEQVAEHDKPEHGSQPTHADNIKKCFYHEDRDAVTTCSRCGQPVCSECNYITGTHPICRNCWEKRVSA